METCILPPNSNGVLPPPPPPGVGDPSLGGFLSLYATCRAMNQNAPQEVASLINDVNEMVDSSHCIIDTSSIVSVRTSRPLPAPAWLRDGPSIYTR